MMLVQKIRHIQSISMTILAIATAALGVGLFATFGEVQAAALTPGDWKAAVA